jgi:hypothetical protein
VKAVLILIAFVAGGVLTWQLTVRRVTREVAPGAGGATGATEETSEASDTADASGFGGPRSGESSGAAGARWMGDAEDEDALLPEATVPKADTRRGTPPPD